MLRNILHGIQTMSVDGEFCAQIEREFVVAKCRHWDDGYCRLFCQTASVTRAPACIEAEKRCRDLVGAGQLLRESEPRHHGESGLYRMVLDDTWDKAVEAIGEEA